MPLVEASDALYAEVRGRLAARAARPAVLPYTGDPLGFISKHLGEHLWSKEEEIIRAVLDHRHVAVHSAHALGKSFTGARLIAYWLATHPVGEAFVVSTAPTFSQVRAILWREVGRAYRRGNLPGRLNQTEWWMSHSAYRYPGSRPDEELVGFGRKPSDTDPTAFQGIHAKFVLVVIDEASGVPQALFEATEAIATGDECRILAIGNPDDPQSYFAKACLPGSGWHVIHVGWEHCPNNPDVDEEIPVSLRGLLLSQTWVDERRAEWGEDSPLFISKVLGRFPDDKADGVIRLSAIRACQGEREWPADTLLPVELGVDVGAGGDQTVIRERCGVRVGRTWRYRTPESEQAVGYVMQAIRETQPSAVKVDVIGIGWGVCGQLEELRRKGEHRAQIVRVNVGNPAKRPNRFPRLRDELWWTFRELTEAKAIDLGALDDTTIAQLIAPTWRPDSMGRIQIEAKADTRGRIGRSPDDADALLLAMAMPGRQKAMVAFVDL